MSLPVSELDIHTHAIPAYCFVSQKVPRISPAVSQGVAGRTTVQRVYTKFESFTFWGLKIEMTVRLTTRVYLESLLPQDL